MKPAILYYTTHCGACVELFIIIMNEGIKDIFILKCLDGFSSEQLCSLPMKQLPAIILEDQNGMYHVYEGAKQCGNWINAIIQNRRLNINMHVENQRKMIQKEHANLRNQNGYSELEYNEEEMEGVSDSYSYVATDLHQAKNFIPVGQEENFNIVTPQMKEATLKKDEMIKNINFLKDDREKDTNELKKIMEQKQIYAVKNPGYGYQF
jgi:molecular chaperone DnaK (HSP70)